MPIDALKVILAAISAFLIGIALTPRLTNFLYSKKMWKKVAGKIAATGEEAVIFNSLHKDKESAQTPRLGGIIAWTSVLVTALLFWVLSQVTDIVIFDKIEFISRDQTWIPLAVLTIGALIGLVDDLLEIRWQKEGSYSKGLSLSFRLAFVALVGLFVGGWFYTKLDASAISMPFFGPLEVGGWYIALFVITLIVLYSGGVIDGLDGLSGGVFSIIYSAYAAIAFAEGQYNVAALCAAIAGGTLAFLWFNIPPARFYLSETGSMPLTITLGVIAFMTDSFGTGEGIAVLPIVAFPLLATAASSLIQVASKKIRKKKVFLVAPLHHHFEAIGWPREKVVMRYWIITVACALMGIIIALIDVHA
jgi:phospho-N-acetylmuramoyl-pentapeptide-transferase